MGPTQPPIQWVSEALVVQRPVREADHSPPSSARVKTGEAILPTPTSLHGVVLNYIMNYRYNFTFTFMGQVMLPADLPSMVSYEMVRTFIIYSELEQT
jgi:hypothetical protein